MNIFKSVWLWLTGIVLGSLALLKSVVLRRVRIGKEIAAVVNDLIKERGRTFVISEELTRDQLPKTYDALCLLDGIPFRFTVEERILRAGFSGTDSVASITAFRWQLMRLIELTEKQSEADEIFSHVLRPWDAERIGRIKIPNKLSEPYMESSTYAQLDAEVAEVVSGMRIRTSTLLHGTPGNGKSYLARYLALRYKLPIYLVALTPDTNNLQIIRMFGNLRGPAMILFEDFDSYFDGRQCLLKDAQITFDAILNVLDGLFATLDGMIVVMTCNDLERVDSALRTRPGRLRHVIEVPAPVKAVRERIFKSHPDRIKLVSQLAGYSLDELLMARDAPNAGAAIDEVEAARKAVAEEVERIKRAKEIQDNEPKSDPKCAVN